jgi:hypothetical protein
MAKKSKARVNHMKVRLSWRQYRRDRDKFVAEELQLWSIWQKYKEGENNDHLSY